MGKPIPGYGINLVDQDGNQTADGIWARSSSIPRDESTSENYRNFFLTIAYFFAMILNNNKGYDGEGSAQVLFQRAGGWCEPVTDAQNL